MEPTNKEIRDAICIDADELLPVDGQDHLWHLPLGPRLDVKTTEALQKFKETERAKIVESVQARGLRIRSISEAEYVWIQAKGGLCPEPNRIFKMIVVPKPRPVIAIQVNSAEGETTTEPFRKSPSPRDATNYSNIQQTLEGPPKAAGTTAGVEMSYRERPIQSELLEEPVETWFQSRTKQDRAKWAPKKYESQLGDTFELNEDRSIYVTKGGIALLALGFNLEEIPLPKK